MKRVFLALATLLTAMSGASETSGQKFTAGWDNFSAVKFHP
jgi:hypothetical protein